MLPKSHHFPTVALITAVALVLSAPTHSQVVADFAYTGAPQNFVVPPGVTEVHLEAWGAAGWSGSNPGGLGGHAEGDLTVTPGETLEVRVGGAGQGCTMAYVPMGGGYNGGGHGQHNSTGSPSVGGGGGASDVRRGGSALANRVIVAPGGGSATNNSTSWGGDGGGLTGEDGGQHLAYHYGLGATQVAGGDAGGALGQGGNADGTMTPWNGGGGGGYFGGGVSRAHSGGGGGSAYIGGVANGVTTPGVRSGDGRVTITYNVANVALRAVSATPTVVAPSGSGYMVSITAENLGLNAVDVTSIDLTFTDAVLIDVTSEYTVTPDPGNPTSIAAGATLPFLFLVGVMPSATLGPITIDAQISIYDPIVMAAGGDLDADTPDAWTVVSALPVVREVDATAMTVSPGGSGYTVEVTVENLGPNPLIVVNVALTFTGTADRTAEYLAVADPANPATIGAFTLATFAFLVDVAPSATLELVTLDAAIIAVDAVSGAFLVDVDADTTDAWTVVACAVPLCGDCSGDLQVSIIDALVAAQNAAGAITLVGAAFTACNVLGALEPSPAAQVDILDALRIAQTAAGLPLALVCC